MSHPGRPAAEQCEGDRLVADRYVGILVSYLRDADQVYETYVWQLPWPVRSPVPMFTLPAI